jgi:hypothetical protein
MFQFSLRLVLQWLGLLVLQALQGPLALLVALVLREQLAQRQVRHHKDHKILHQHHKVVLLVPQDPQALKELMAKVAVEAVVEEVQQAVLVTVVVAETLVV